MAHAGEGYKFHVTGLTHDERGYPNMTPRAQDMLVGGCRTKFATLLTASPCIEEEDLEDADIVVVSYGITSRVAQRAIDMARNARGLRVGKFRHDHRLAIPGEREFARSPQTIKAFVVPELNLGQMVHEVERSAAGLARTHFSSPTRAAAYIARTTS